MRRNPNPHADPSLRDAVDVTRFWSLVQKQRTTTECWLWLGDTDRNGYGIFQWHGRRRPAHELALSFTTGEVRLERLDTCHSCHVPGCCNPAHLRFDTRQSNVREMVAVGRGRNGSTKLTVQDIIDIRERRAQGAKQQDLADEYNLTDGYVSMLVRGLRWREVGGPIQEERTKA